MVVKREHMVILVKPWLLPVAFDPIGAWVYGSNLRCQELAALNIKPSIVQGGAPKIVKLVYNSNNYGLWYL